MGTVGRLGDRSRRALVSFSLATTNTICEEDLQFWFLARIGESLVGLSCESWVLEIVEIGVQSECGGFDLVGDTCFSDTHRAQWSIPSAAATARWACAARIIRCPGDGLGTAVFAWFADPFSEAVSVESAATGAYVGTKRGAGSIPPSAALVRFSAGIVLRHVDSVVCVTDWEDPRTALVRACNRLCDSDVSGQVTLGVGLEECATPREQCALGTALDRLGPDARGDWGVYRIFVFREIHGMGRRRKLVVAARVSSPCPVLHSLRSRSLRSRWIACGYRVIGCSLLQA